MIGTIVRSLNNSEKGFIMSGQRLRTFGCCITTRLRHTAISVNKFFMKKGIPMVLQSPYSPDLSPCDLFLLQKLKFHLKGRHFGTVDNIQKVLTDQLRALPLRLCVAAQENYFEGDNVDL
jgi:hypothetical protein